MYFCVVFFMNELKKFMCLVDFLTSFANTSTEIHKWVRLYYGKPTEKNYTKRIYIGNWGLAQALRPIKIVYFYFVLKSIHSFINWNFLSPRLSSVAGPVTYVNRSWVLSSPGRYSENFIEELRWNTFKFSNGFAAICRECRMGWLIIGGKASEHLFMRNTFKRFSQSLWDSWGSFFT